MAGNVELFYKIPKIKIDKTKPIYSPRMDTVFITPSSDNDKERCKFYMECIKETSEGEQNLIMFAREKIHPECRKLKFDNFGRFKVRTIVFRDYMRSKYPNLCNIEFDLVDFTPDYFTIKI